MKGAPRASGGYGVCEFRARKPAFFLPRHSRESGNPRGADDVGTLASAAWQYMAKSPASDAG